MVARARLFCEGVLGIFVGMGLDPSAHPAVRGFLAVSYFGQSGTERSRPFPTNLRFFASHDPKYSCPPHGSLPHRLRAEPPRRGGQEGRVFSTICGNGFIFSFALSKTVIYGILFFYRSTGKPGANRRRKAIGAHRVSQCQQVIVVFTAVRSFASFLGQELTRVKTQRYTGGTKQGTYNALLLSAARGYYYLIRSDSAFRYGSTMP